MGNYDVHLYVVTDGEAIEVAEPVTCGRDAILVAARTRDGALEVAKAYDRELTDYDNFAWRRGATISAVRLRDPVTGEYY